MSMKRFAIIVQITLFLMYLCTSCVDETLVKSGTSDVQFRFTISTAEEGVVDVKTKGDTSADINDIWVLVFKGDDKKISTSVKATSVGNNAYYANLDKNDLENSELLVLANIERVMATSAGFGTTYGELQSKLVVQLNRNKEGLIVQDASPISMVSDLNSYNGLSLDFTLNRSAAKVTVEVDASNTKYKLLGTNLAHVASKGAVFEENTLTDYGVGNYAGIVSGDTYSTDVMLSESTDGLTTSPLYVFYTPKDNQPSIIVKGEFDGVEGYIRLALWEARDNYYDITRNHQYIVKMKSISIAGYRTADEAIKNAPSNELVGAEISVIDPSAHDIVSNGEQYLGVSNSSLIIYNGGEVDNLLATVCTYTCANDWINNGSQGFIRVTGDGLTLAGGNKEKQFALNSTSTKEATEDVKINCDKDFQTGTLTLHIGNLSKVVHIEKRDSLSATPDELLFEGVTVGDQKESAVRDEIQFAEESGKYELERQQGNLFFSNTGKLYVLVSANVGYGTNLRDREGEFFVASSEDDGRTKVVFTQKKLDVYSELAQIRPYTFVGTFHRANETAERIIRIKTTDKVGSKWKAIVVVGQDFIELDKNPSPDQGITRYAYGVENIDKPDGSAKDDANWTTATEVENNCQFRADEKGKILISGEVTTDTPCIYFRVGMKSRLPGGAIGAPRYGLIALIHATGTHLIYVRQGESDDYLLRPSDPIPGGEAPGQSRVMAKKISPFNLTLTKDLRDKLTKWFDFPDGEKADFTDYPSQGGYFFQAYPSRAYYPVGSVADVNWQKTSKEKAKEVFPDKYRLPKDGVDNNSGSVVGSEMRQSFWLNPFNGQERSSYDNMLRGYIADGYYDRRPMRVPNTQNHQNEGAANIYEFETVDEVTYRIPTLVGEGAEIGYAGILLYNPYNFASIFIPANGSRFGSLENLIWGQVQGTGAESNLWSGTYFNSNAWYLATGYYNTPNASWVYSWKFVLDNYKSSVNEAFSLRCVKDN